MQFDILKHIRWKLVFYDLIVISSISWFSFGIYSMNGLLNQDEVYLYLSLFILCVFITRIFGGVYRIIWRFGGIEGYLRLILVDSISGILFLIIEKLARLDALTISRSLILFLLNLLACMVMRMLYRYCYKFGTESTRMGSLLNSLMLLFAGYDLTQERHVLQAKKRVAILGAGRVGSSLAEEINSNTHYPYIVACFIEIDASFIGRNIRGITVLNEEKVTPDILHDMKIDEIVFAVPSMDSKHRKELYERYHQTGIPIKTYDYPIIRTTGSKRQLREFSIEELLFRTPVTMEDEKTHAYYKDKTILITGGGGSIGSELGRQVASMEPDKIILLDIYENGVYDLQQELKMGYGNTIDVCIEIVSITNRTGMERVFAKYHPQIVIHAAAHKHVPLMENNCIEAVENNVFGTLNVVELCEQYHVERFIALSTDKAVNPTNVMGATKRMCEYIIQAFSTEGNVKYSATRFGNVLGSAGSVIPLFKKQIQNGGPITVTDFRIIRYFMTIPEASQLVLQSGEMAKNGELFVLDMGNPVKILDLAVNMIELCGFVPYEDIDIIETGLRPGEKLYEELLVKSDQLDKTENDLIFIERENPLSMKELENRLVHLKNACKTGDDDQVRAALKNVVPTFRNAEEINK